jgi:lipopolysaccharide export LptBFGC system permease protein LptF
MRAASIPLWRISAPYFLVGLVFSLAVFYVNEQLLPAGADAAQGVMRRHVKDQSKGAEKIWRRNFFFVNPIDNRSWRMGAFHLQSNLMTTVQFDWRMTNGWRTTVFAKRANWQGRRWVFSEVEELIFPPGFVDPISVTNAVLVLPQTNHFIFTSSNIFMLQGSNAFTIPLTVGGTSVAPNTNVLLLPQLTETPRVIRSEIKISALSENFRSLRRVQLSSGEILDYLRLHPRLDRKRANSLRTLLHSRLAAPWICLVVVLIAVPFGAIPGRRNVFVGVASSVFICFLFFFTKDLTVALGTGGYVPPWLAGWIPNLVFATTGIVLMRRVR